MAVDVERAFVIADLAGYTALTEAHGGAGAAEIVHRFFELVRRALGERCRIVDHVGDQVLVAAHDVGDAARMAVGLRDAAEAEPNFPALRVGVHVGRVIEDDGHYFGPAVNLTARVAAHAHAGQVLCTAGVASALPGAGGIHRRPLGMVRFRNVPEPVEVFELAATDGIAVLDPVCMMQVEPATAAARMPYGDGVYHFCSIDCAAMFAQHPDAYVPER